MASGGLTTGVHEAPKATSPLKRAIVGRPMATEEIEETLLPKTLALPIFASDPLSSVAYATESALVVLVAASATAAHFVFPISLGIAVLLAIVVASYRQTVRAYQTSGGAYVVAKDNLGTLPSLVGAAALLIDYVLTVAVSIAAGIFAVTSLAPSLEPHKVGLSLACLAVIVLVNLRGVRDSGLVFALPTYGFVAAMLILVAVGLFKTTFEDPHAVTPDPIAAGAGGVTLFVLLRAFASGSTALTGVEAIANGVNAFRHPHGENAAKTLGVLGAIAITLFLGVSYLAVQEHAWPSESASVVSQIARATFPDGSPGSFMYFAVQALTLAILVLAANTSFQGFPRLAALLARDRFAPRQFVNLGDRLVFSNGMLVLASVAALLLWRFHADVDSLIHLYVIGVFTAFTLSQAGMVRYWHRTREGRWRYRALVNGAGAAATGLVTLIVVVTKFSTGAWMVLVAMPALVLGFYGVRRHYRGLARRLHAGTDAVVAASPATNRTLLVVQSIDEAAADALWFVRSTNGGSYRAVHVPRPQTDPGIKPRWFRYSDEESLLQVLDGSLGLNEAVLQEVWRLPRGEADFVTVVIPELFRRASLLDAFRRPRAFLLKLRLLTESGVVVADVPVVEGVGAAPPDRAVVRVLVSELNAASMRALNYAKTLQVPDTKAVNFAFSAFEAAHLRHEWRVHDPGVPLEVDEAPFRDIGTPLLRRLREITADEQAEAIVVMPELVVRGARRLLHNQRALYVKRLLLFEERVILCSVPYQLMR